MPNHTQLSTDAEPAVSRLTQMLNLTLPQNVSSDEARFCRISSRVDAHPEHAASLLNGYRDLFRINRWIVGNVFIVAHQQLQGMLSRGQFQHGRRFTRAEMQVIPI